MAEGKTISCRKNNFIDELSGSNTFFLYKYIYTWYWVSQILSPIFVALLIWHFVHLPQNLILLSSFWLPAVRRLQPINGPNFFYCSSALCIQYDGFMLNNANTPCLVFGLCVSFEHLGFAREKAALITFQRLDPRGKYFLRFYYFKYSYEK